MMKVVILAGGYGSRFGKTTDYMPKPMVPIGPMPILWHLIQYYMCFGYEEFIIATGYKSELIKEFFANLSIYTSDFTVSFESGHTKISVKEQLDCRPKITVAYTGQDTMTGGRIKRIERYLGEDETFMLTYGDGLADIDLQRLRDFHMSHGKLATLTAVYPPAKFGSLRLENGLVTSFSEKQGLQGGLVNGGFYVMNRQVIGYIDNETNCVLEKGPMEKLAEDGQLVAYQHLGYWQCMDTTRDLDSLQSAWSNGVAPWRKWNKGYVD